ncbi:MAG: sugar-binding protein [Armatimonadia bacterium]
MRALVAVLVIAVAASVVAAAPVATAVRLDKPIALDGKLTEAVWAGVAPIRDFSVLGEDAKAKQQTEAWLAYDDDNLYIAVKAHESQMDKLAATVTERDGKVFNEDVIEIFVDPAKTNFAMLQFAFNPLGTQADLMGDAVGMSMTWNGLWQVKVARGADFWSAEVALPFATLGVSPLVKSEWGLNICRERAADGELSCWAPTAKFGAPASFGRVTLTPDLKPFYVELGVKDWGQGLIGANSLKATVRNTGDGPRNLTLKLHVPRYKPSANEWDIEEPLGTVAPGQTVEREVKYVIPVAGNHPLTVQVLDGTRLVAVVGRAMGVSPVAEFSVFKSFYRDDVVVRYQVNVPKGELGKYRVRCQVSEVGKQGGETAEAKATATAKAEGEATAAGRDARAPHGDGNGRRGTSPRPTAGMIAEKKVAGFVGELRFGTAGLPRGQYVVEAAILDKAGKVALAQTLQFAVLRDDSVKQRLVTIRQSDNMLIAQGKPIFPLGIYESPGTETYMKRLREAGFDLFIAHTAAGSTLLPLLDMAQQHGARFWVSMGSLLDFSKDAEKKRAQLKDVAEGIGAHPALLLWESIDEPAWGSQSAEGLYDGYCYLREIDQQRPIWTNHAPRNTIPELAHFNRATDIGGADIYPVPEPQTQSDLPNKAISVVGDETDKNMAAVNGEKPVFMVLQGFGWGELSKKKGQPVQAVMPTFEQSRFMAYQSIVHGANGILYWGTHYTQKPSQFWSELKTLTSELSALQGVLAAEKYEGKDKAALVTRRAGVRLLQKRLDGHDYVIVVNELAEPVKVALVVPTMKGTKARRLFEGQDVAVAKGRMSVDLAGYGVAVLSDDMGLRDVRKDFSAEWKNPAPKTGAQLEEPGNEILNGGFEADADEDGMPEAWNANTPLTVSLVPEAHAGKQALRIKAIGGEAAPLVVQRGAGIVGGKQYTFSAWVKAKPETEFRIYVEWVVGGKFYGKVLPWTKGTGEWQKVSYVIKGEPDPQGGAYAVAQVKGTGEAVFDELRIEEMK